jgi:hypothetical protein
MAKGTMTYEDIYGAGSLDTLGASSVGETQQKTNPNNPDVTGSAKPGETSIFHLKGNILGQPIMIWVGLIILLVVLKFVLEKD